jgi:methylase of polypeptide subunit release factors
MLLMKKQQDIKYYATDINPMALDVAKRTAEHNKC